MPSASRSTTPVGIDLDIVERRYAELGDYTVSFESFKQDLDVTPYFRGLPGDACTYHHVGYVTAGQITFRWPDHEETFVEGDGWLETGVRPEGLFSDDVFADLTVPQWRVQSEGADAACRLREDSHPFPGTVRVEALDHTSRGFLLQFEERWQAGGQQWYCRELVHCAVTGGRISEMSVYCTGDWDEARQREHTAAVRLVRR